MPKKSVDRRGFLKGVTLAGLAGLAPAAEAAPAATPAATASAARKWDKEADVVVVGSGAAGLPASIIAKENGASVILVEANRDIGGHAAVCSGNIPLGAGTKAQKDAGIVDSPDILFKDLTDWSVVEHNGAPAYRFNDRDIMRAFADNNVFAYDFLVSHGLVFTSPVPQDNGWGNAAGNSVHRAMHAAVMDWPLIQTGKPADPAVQKTTPGGIGIVRPLEAAARKAGVQILLEHRMISVIRENNNTGRVVGITVETKGAKLNIRARKGVILCTGGHSSNVNFRRIFDPRLTEEYCGVAGGPYTPQDASGEIAGMAVGASLWGAGNQTAEFGNPITKPGYVGCQYGYGGLTPPWEPTSEYFHLARATGLRVKDYQNVIEINQVGLRIYNETVDRHPSPYPPYVQNSWRNAANIKWEPNNYIPAALGLNGGTGNGGGPIWTIFDAEAVKREKWTVEPPDVDREAGFFFSGDTIAELAANISKNKYQKNPMPAQALQDTIARYNSFVDAGKDADFDKPAPKYKIQTPPFYAAWSTPVPHDCRAGLRINARNQVQDLYGKVIPGLYCAGESAGGFNEHGIGRCVVGGLIAGRNAAGKDTIPEVAPAAKAATASTPAKASSLSGAAPAALAALASTKEECLECHGPFTDLKAAPPSYATANGEHINPHRFIPHNATDAKSVPECTNCHTPHDLTDPKVDLSKMDVHWCYDTCHHESNFTPCKECHDSGDAVRGGEQQEVGGHAAFAWTRK